MSLWLTMLLGCTPSSKLPYGEIDDDWTLAEHAVVFRHLGDQGAHPDLVAPRLGATVALVDANLDGQPDIAVSAPFWQDARGVAPATAIDVDVPTAVFFLDGSDTVQLDPATATDVQDSSFAVVWGGPFEYRFGESITLVGDLNDNGTPEVEINRWPRELPLVGEIDLRADSAWSIDAPGWSVQMNSVPCGDVNEDGFDDYCSAPGVWFGPIGDGTSFHDAALLDMGEHFQTGQLRTEGPLSLVAGRDTPDLRGLIQIWHSDRQGGFEDPIEIHGIAPGDWVGKSLAVGDLTGDGRGDVLVGSTLAHGQAGHAWIWTDPEVGGSLLDATIEFSGGHTEDRLGGVMALGDFDGDGELDIAFGMPGSSTRPGRVAVFRGPFAAGVYTEEDAARIWYGSPYAGDSFGAALAAGDINGDGVDELIIGAPDDAQIEPYGGALYVLDDVL